MIPIRWHRVLFGFAMVSAVIALIDEICIWLLPSQGMRHLITGLVTGGAVFMLAYRGGSVVRFVMGKRLNDDALDLMVSEAHLLIGATKLPRFEVLLFDSPKPSAFTVSDGARSCIFMSAGLVRGLPPKALAGVIAHESGHILEWHPRKQAAILGMLALVKGTSGITIVAVILVLFAYLYMLREWEFVADCRAAGMIGSDRMVTTFAEYRALSGEKDISRLSELMCSHPSLNRRIAALNCCLPAIAKPLKV